MVTLLEHNHRPLLYGYGYLNLFDINKIYTDLVSWFAVTVIGGLVGYVLTLMRKVNTNEKQLTQDRHAHKAQIDLILAELENRDNQRGEDRERMGRVETDVRDIKNALLGKNG